MFDFAHGLTGTLSAAAQGKTDLTGTTGLPALDLERSDLLAGTGTWRDSGITDGSTSVESANSLIPLLTQARSEWHDVYLFGRIYTGGDLGVHDTHMNQGLAGSYIDLAGNDHNNHNDSRQDGVPLVDLGQPESAASFAAIDQQLAPTDDLGNPKTDARPLSGSNDRF